MAVYFVRHGETECNVKKVYYGSLDVSINEKGRHQAEAVGEMLRDVVFDRIITSGLQRTQQTAKAILSKQNEINTIPELESMDVFNEMNFGKWEGLHYTRVREDYPKDYKAMMEDWVHCPPTGGEVFMDFNRRVLEGWESLHIRDGENILFAGHGGPIQCLMCYLLGMGPSQIWHLEISQGTYTKFEIHKGFPVLKGMNLERRELLG